MALKRGQQQIDIAGEVVVRVAFQHIAVFHGQAPIRQQTGIVRHILLGIGRGREKLAALGKIIADHAALLGGQIAHGAIDEKQTAIVRHGLHREQGKLLYLHVLQRNGRLHRIGKHRFPMPRQHIHHGQTVARDIADGAGELLLAGEGVAVVLAVVIIVVGVLLIVRVGPDVGIRHIHMPLAAHNNKAVVRGRFRGIGRKEVRILHRIDPCDGNMGILRVAAKQLPKRFILAAALHDPVDLHVSFQRGKTLLAFAGQGIKLLRCHIPLGNGAGQRTHQQIHRHRDGQHDHDRQHTVAARGGAAGFIGGLRLFAQGFQLVHQLHLLFSMLCTVRNRNRAMTDR